MGDLLINNVRVMQPGRGIIGDSLRISNGKVSVDDAPVESTEIIDGGGRLLTPGLIDLHTHGLHHHLYEASPEELVNCAGLLGRYGTTTALPTLYTVMKRDSLKKVEALAEAMASVDTACLPGFHMEGPFLKITGAGADTIPGDVGLLKELLAASGDRVTAMSISPDTANIIPVIEYLTERGVVSFITHTKASPEQTAAAIEAGARHATHFYDVFPLPEETDPGARPVGAVETILADARCTVDFIADGVHVHPMAIRAAFAAKGTEGVCLITDSNIGAGLPAGVYESPWGYPIRTAPGRAARMERPGHKLHGVLAGSALTMNEGIANLRRWLDIPDDQVWAMGTTNPARAARLPDKGHLQPGADADLVLWDEDNNGRFTANRTWVGGRCVFSR
ncbi:MAG: amidohydrolase family protein [Phycisphaerales bacterium]